MAGMKPSRELIEGWRRQALSDLRNAEFGAHDVCVLLCQRDAEWAEEVLDGALSDDSG